MDKIEVEGPIYEGELTASQIVDELERHEIKGSDDGFWLSVRIPEESAVQLVKEDDKSRILSRVIQEHINEGFWRISSEWRITDIHLHWCSEVGKITMECFLSLATLKDLMRV